MSTSIRKGSIFVGLHVYFVVLFHIKSVSSALLHHADTLNQMPASNGGPPMVNTSYGSVQGVFLNNGPRAFLGIPYAAPPVGKLRWQPPQKPAKWNVYKATRQPPGCPQICHDPVDSCPLFYLEDCLYLNIYTPPNVNSSSDLPVMMYIHGGNFRNGGIASVLFDGRFLTLLTNAVVVTTNYRLGALGFMTTTCIAGTSCLTGNYGFMDQVAAMEFVHENIAAFGGNPKKVTLFGQSAGAQSISLHLTNSKSDKYFQHAIIESGPFTLPYRDHINSALLGDLTAAFLNCLPGDLDCLITQSAKDVIAAGTAAGKEVALDIFGPLHLFEPWGPIIDGQEIHTNPLIAFRNGTFQRKPLLIGTLTEEGRNYIWQAFPKKPSSLEISVFLFYIFGEAALGISREYIMTDFDDLREPLSSIATDYIFACSTFNGSRQISSKNESLVFHYIFDHAISFNSVWGPNYTECFGHVCHGSELPLLWRTQALRGYNFTAAEQQLADAMNNYWSNFVHTGNPNNNSWTTKMKGCGKKDLSNKSKDENEVLIWPAYKGDSKWQSLLFESSGNTLLSKFRERFCRLYDDVGYTPN